ncbi:MAG: NAD(P)-binding protein [Massilia sp.]
MAQLQKIAVLGGGVGSLAAAFFLTDQPGWRERYQVTVYQQGWRLGGKGASGRNAQFGQRVEEHGLHIWFGFYANAFALMRSVYEGLARPPGAPLATLADAFREQDYIALAEQVGDTWHPWNLVLPRRPGEPGIGNDPVTPWQMALEAIAWLRRWHSDLRMASPQAAAAPSAGAPFDALLALAHALAPDARQHRASDHELLTRALVRVQRVLREPGLASASDQARRALVALNIGVTVIKGMLADGVFTRGFDVINGEDLRAWLARHGGDPQLCVDSTPVLAMYHQLFAYEDGDPARPSLEAGTALRWMMRMSFAYRGSVMYRMEAGMGDAVVAPLYQLLEARGVRFAFFHRIEELEPDGDGVGSIRMTVQAALKGDDYDPLVSVKGLPCWPSAPDYGQLDPAQAALLQEHAIDLESYWSDWPGRYQQAFGTQLPSVTLRRGVDFDQVVCGLSIGSLPVVAPRLLESSAALRTAVDKVRTVATQAYQVWLDRDLAQLGWTGEPAGQEPIVTGFSAPYDTWAPMDQVLPREDWPSAYAPRQVSYFCGAMALAGYPPQRDTGFPGRVAARAKADAVEQLRERIGGLWPAVQGGFPWQSLVDPLGANGVARFDRQYWRANVDPSERYVLSVPGSSAARPASAGSGFSNMVLAGDWLRTGLDSGCVEAAVMGGMQASRALSGYPAAIAGDSDL